MRSILSFVGGIKNLFATIAQVILLILLFPVFAFVASLIFPEASLFSLSQVLESIPVFGYFIQFFSELSQSAVGTIPLLEFLEELMLVVEAQVFSAMVIGLCVYCIKLIGNKIGILGLPILQVVIGTIIGAFLVAFLEPSIDNLPGSAFVISQLVIGAVILTFVLERGQWLQKMLGLFLGISLSAITAAVSVAYISVMVLIALGRFPDVKTAILLFLATAIPFLIFVTIDFTLMMPKKIK